MAEHSVLLHESTRRSLCRIAFILFGLLPLAACCLIAGTTLLPGYSQWQASGWERSLSQRVGLTIRVGAAQSLAPLHYRLENVELYHPETHRKVGSIDSLSLRQQNGRWLLSASTARLNARQLPDCCKAVHEWYVCRPLSDRRRAVANVERLIMEYADQSSVLSNIVAELLPESGKWGFKATFASSESSVPSQARPDTPSNQLILVRYHDPENSATEMQLRASSSLPIWMVAPGIQVQTDDPQVSMFQSILVNGRFTGVLDVRFHASEATSYLTQATFENLDFGQAGVQTPLAISGTGHLILSQAKWDSQGLQWAKGSLDLGPGRIDANLLHSLAHYLQWEVPRQNPTQNIAFDRIAAGFRIQPGSIQVVGAVADGTLISDAHGSLARRLDPSALPLSNLVHALAASDSGPSFVRKSLVWLPLDDSQRRETAQVLRIKRY